MAYEIGRLLGAFGQLVVIVGFVTGLLLAWWIPFMLFSLTRNVRQIRIALEQIGAALAANPPRPATPMTSDVFRPNPIERPGAVSARPGRLGI